MWGHSGWEWHARETKIDFKADRKQKQKHIYEFMIANHCPIRSAELSLNCLPCFHFFYYLLQLSGIQLPQVQSQIHSLVAVLEGPKLSELDAMFIEFRMLFEVGFEL